MSTRPVPALRRKSSAALERPANRAAISGAGRSVRVPTWALGTTVKFCPRRRAAASRITKAASSWAMCPRDASSRHQGQVCVALNLSGRCGGQQTIPGPKAVLQAEKHEINTNF